VGRAPHAHPAQGRAQGIRSEEDVERLVDEFRRREDQPARPMTGSLPDTNIYISGVMFVDCQCVPLTWPSWSVYLRRVGALPRRTYENLRLHFWSRRRTRRRHAANLESVADIVAPDS